MQTQSCWIIGSGSLSPDDQKTLNLLYLPLISPNSLSLYLLFNALVKENLQSDMYPIQFLVDMLNIQDKDFSKAIDKLEAIGLLNTYVKDNIVMYRLVMPLTPKQFITDGLLGSFLKSEVGEANFDLIREKFEVTEITRKGYTNITKSFDEVYQIHNLDQLETPLYILGRKNSGGILIANTFDFDNFYKNLPVRLQKKSLFTKKIKDQIASINYVYQYNLDTLNQIVNEAYLEDNPKMFYERIGLLASKYMKQNNTKVEIDLKPAKEAERVHLDQYTPQEILSHFNSDMTNNSLQLETIRQFVERNAVDIGVLNAVIIYSIRLKNELPNLNYLEKVLVSLKEKGVTTEALAYDFLMQTEKKEKPSYKGKDRIVRDKPEWMDEFEKLVEERSK